jgi:uncharacterized membrane protein
MANEHRAVFALSIAYTASIAAYPNFPPDIFDRMFVAFLLPITATVIWWLLGRLHSSAVQHGQGSLSCSAHMGPATVLFLSAFHITMLIALIGAHLWIGRILGLIVGVFLIATGNELPRVRSNPFRGSRAPQTLGNDDVWKRVHRLRGYVRVIMGSAVCGASLAGLRGFSTLIVVAVSVEIVACLGAATLFSRQKPGTWPGLHTGV